MHPNNRIYHNLVAQAGWDRARVARELRVSRSTVMRWARNQIIPEESKLVLLAELSRQSVTLGGETLSPEVPRDRSVPIDHLARSVFSALRSLPTEKQRRLLLGLQHMISAAEIPQTEIGKIVAESDSNPGDTGAVGSSKEGIPPDILAGVEVELGARAAAMNKGRKRGKP